MFGFLAGIGLGAGLQVPGRTYFNGVAERMAQRAGTRMQDAAPVKATPNR